MTRIDEINEYFNSLNDELAAVGISLVNGILFVLFYPLS